MLISIISLLSDQSVPISKDASRCLINISANDLGAKTLLNLDTTQNCPPLQKPPDNVIIEVLNHIFDSNSYIADPCCMILSNITRTSQLIEKIIDIIESSNKTFDELVNIFTKNEYNKHGAKLHYLGPVLSNLTQSSRVRKYILDKNRCVIQRLLPFTEYKDSLVRRGGTIGKKYKIITISS